MRYLTIILLLTSGALCAQPTHWLNFSTGKNINDVVFKGNQAWIATKGGLIRYNINTGERKIFNRANSNLPINDVHCMAIDTGGGYWVGTGLGLSHFDGQSFTLPFSPLTPDAIYGNRSVEKMAALPNGDLWIRIRWGHSNPLMRYHNQQWENITQTVQGNNDGLDMLPGKNNDMWLLNNSNSPSSLYHYQNGVASLISSNNLPGIQADAWYCDAQNNLWVLDGNTFLKFDGAQWTTIPLDGQNIYSVNDFAISPEGTFWMSCNSQYRKWDTTHPADEVYCYAALEYHDELYKVYVAPDSSAWFSTGASGIIRVDRDGNLSTIQPILQGLRSNYVDRIRISDQQDIWASCADYPIDLNTDFNQNSGFSRFNNGHWDDFYTFNPGGNNVPYNSRSLAIDKSGHPWLATYYNVTSFDGAQWNINNVPGGDTAYIFSTATDPVNGKVWAGGKGRIFRQDGNGFVAINHPVADYLVGQMEVDYQGGVWTCRSSIDPSVWRFYQNTWTRYLTTDMKLGEENAYVRKLNRTIDGKIWVLAAYGVSSFDGAEWTPYQYSNTPAIVKILYVNAVAVDHKGNTWFGYYLQHCTDAPDDLLGLCKLKDDVWTFYPFNATGLPWPNITDMTVDSVDNIWIGTENCGIAVFNETQIILGATAPPGFANGLADLIITPNPVSDIALLSFPGLGDNTNLNVIVSEPTGKIVLTSMHHAIPAQLDVSVLPSGLYFVSIFENGRPLVTKKMIKL